MKQRHEIYANDKLWDKTSCPFETEVLNQEGYNIGMGEWYGLEDELSAAKIKFISTGTNNDLHVTMSWKDDKGKDPDPYVIQSIIYSYKGYLYHVKMCLTHGVAGFTMTREPQFNKKDL